MKRAPVVAILFLGLGLAAAPAIFQMFSRAPEGGKMINEFRPYMTEAKVEQFQGFMAEIDAAVTELDTQLEPEARQQLGLDAAAFDEQFPLLARFQDDWHAIFADMNDDMLVTIDDNRDNYAAVDALPPFAMFPWFFVIPGLLTAGLATSVLLAGQRARPARGRLLVLAVVGLGLVAAPFVFQMFSRAPEGGDMINDFGPLMTRERVLSIQGYFLVLGGGEGDLRNAVLPELENPEDFPAAAAFVEDWPTINSEMAPMIGAMSDNVDNFAAVDALPPFALFPWFFVIPGVLIAGLAVVARRGTEAAGSTDPAANEATVLAAPDDDTS